MGRLKQCTVAAIAALWSLEVLAQPEPPSPTTGCKVVYEYDAAGSRVQRYWYCWGPPDGMQAEGGGSADAIADDGEVKSLVESNSLRVLPNPADASVALTVKQVLPGGMIEIVDSQGHLVRAKPLATMTTTFDVVGLSAGVYYARLVLGEEMLIVSFVVRHN